MNFSRVAVFCPVIPCAPCNEIWGMSPPSHPNSIRSNPSFFQKRNDTEMNSNKIGADYSTSSKSRGFCPVYFGDMREKGILLPL
jgi:hypothetical protein